MAFRGKYLDISGTVAGVASVLLAAGLLLLFLGSGGAGRMVVTNIGISAYQTTSRQTIQPWCPMDKPTVGGAGAEGTLRSLTFSVSPFPASFWLVMTPGADSSVLTSVFHNICNNYGIDWLNWDVPRLTVGLQQPDLNALKLVQSKREHFSDFTFQAITSQMAYNQGVADVLKPKFLYTIVRHPVTRVQHHYVQAACVAAAEKNGWNDRLPHRQKQDIGPEACNTDLEFRKLALQNDTVEARLAFAKSAQARDHTYDYIRGSKATVQGAAAQYDFIFPAERLNEALVLFMLQHGLTFEDIAYLPLEMQEGPGIATQEMPQDLINFIISNNKKDLLLWEIANMGLDKQRAALRQNCAAGEVERALYAFEILLSEIRDECAGYQHWHKQHGFDGYDTYTGLAGIAYDSGHGYRCVRYVARRFQHTGPIAAAQPGWFKNIMHGVDKTQKLLCNASAATSML